MKKNLINILKITFVGALLVWLANTGKLDFSQLSILLSNQLILTASIAVWLVGALFLGSLRWSILLGGLGISIPLVRVMRLQMIGFFFNTAMPGAVGGDVIKGIYVLKEKSMTSKTHALMTILLDRILGLVAIFIIAGIAILFRLDFVKNHAGLLSISIFVGSGIVAILMAAVFCLTPLFDGRDPIRRLLKLEAPGFKLLLKVYDTILLYRKVPGTIGKAFVISLVVQSMSLIYSYFLAVTLTSQSIDVFVYALVHPVGILTTALPLAPGGLGIGHIAFDRLFVMAGLTGGANVFNVMVLTQLALNLTGLVPYLLYKSEIGEISQGAAAIERASDSVV